MSTESVPQNGVKHPPPSSREIVVDERYAALLAEDLGVKLTTAKTAFLGEPCKRALGVMAWAMEHEPHDPEKRAKMILAWAKKRRAGAFSEAAQDFTGAAMPAMKNGSNGDGERENEVLARIIVEYWVEHPQRFVALLDEVEASVTGKNGNGGRR